MCHLELIVCTKLKVRVFVYFVFCNKCVSFILNIVSTKWYHKKENRRTEFNAFNLYIISGAVILCFGIFYSANIVISLSFIIIYGNLLKYIHFDAFDIQEIKEWDSDYIPHYLNKSR